MAQDVDLEYEVWKQLHINYQAFCSAYQKVSSVKKKLQVHKLPPWLEYFHTTSWMLRGQKMCHEGRSGYLIFRGEDEFEKKILSQWPKIEIMHGLKKINDGASNAISFMTELGFVPENLSNLAYEIYLRLGQAYLLMFFWA